MLSIDPSVEMTAADCKCAGVACERAYREVLADEYGESIAAWSANDLWLSSGAETRLEIADQGMILLSRIEGHRGERRSS